MQGVQRQAYIPPSHPPLHQTTCARASISTTRHKLRKRHYQTQELEITLKSLSRTIRTASTKCNVRRTTRRIHRQLQIRSATSTLWSNAWSTAQGIRQVEQRATEATGSCPTVPTTFATYTLSPLNWLPPIHHLSPLLPSTPRLAQNDPSYC